jgi:D-alanyl-D-alanine dipeptidase
MRQAWSDFAAVSSKSYVRDLVKEAHCVAPADLRDMDKHRKKERMEACSGHDPLKALVAYAQDELIYDAADTIIKADRATYAGTPRENRVNKFGLAYRKGAPFQLHKTLADIVVGAAIRLYKTQGWTTVLYDGLRTMEGAYKLYLQAHDSDLASGLLALPGQSAHNKGLAVDSMMLDENGSEVDMGGHFDHLDMESNSRLYSGDKISETAKQNRLVREAAFLYSAFTQGLLIAPLRNEFWDDRLPENRADLWRVLDSAARCMGISLLSPTDEMLRKTKRQAFAEAWEQWSYKDFLAKWDEVFAGSAQEVKKLFGVRHPPKTEKAEFYHGNYQPIYDRDLRESGKHLTEGSAAA